MQKLSLTSADSGKRSGRLPARKKPSSPVRYESLLQPIVSHNVSGRKSGQSESPIASPSGSV